MNEAQLVARVRELFSPRIGDDAAVIDGQVLTTDLLIEDVDFTRAVPLRNIARKSLAVSLSDLAAMGAAPAYALLSLGLPPWTPTSPPSGLFLDAIVYDGETFDRLLEPIVPVQAFRRRGK